MNFVRPSEEKSTGKREASTRWSALIARWSTRSRTIWEVLPKPCARVQRVTNATCELWIFRNDPSQPCFAAKRVWTWKVESLYDGLHNWIQRLAVRSGKISGKDTEKRKRKIIQKYKTQNLAQSEAKPFAVSCRAPVKSPPCSIYAQDLLDPAFHPFPVWSFGSLSCVSWTSPRARVRFRRTCPCRPFLTRKGRGVIFGLFAYTSFLTNFAKWLQLLSKESRYDNPWKYTDFRQLGGILHNSGKIWWTIRRNICDLN